MNGETLLILHSENGIPVFLYLHKILFGYSVPWYISLALPMTLLIATVFCFTTLQKNHEITALKASGVSIWSKSEVLLPRIFILFFSKISEFMLESFLS